jgi:4-amino-4-deoxy-L-arabinose transferase-like glycosyltransferase
MSDTSSDRASVRPLLLILLAGAAVRLALWLAFDGIPINEGDDEREYNLCAVHLAETGEYAYPAGKPAADGTPGFQPSSIRPPLYPALVAGVYALCGPENFQAVRLLQAGLSLATVLLVYHLGRALYSRRVGLWAAGLYCFYPSLLMYNNLLLSEVLFIFLLCAFCGALLVAVRRRSLAWVAGAGVLLGLDALTRSIMWLFPVPLAVWLLFAWGGRWPGRLGAVVVALAAFAATLAPWSVRNTRLERTFVAVDSMGGRNVMMGNYEYTPLTRAWDAIDIHGKRAWYAVLRAKHPESKSLTQGQRDKLAMKEGVRFMMEHPALTLHRDIIKFFNFWQLEREVVAGASQGRFGTLPRPVLLLLTAVIFGSYATVLFAGFFGALLVRPADLRAHTLFLLLIVFTCGVHTAVFGHSRYHLPLMPLVVTYAAAALVHRGEIWRGRGGWLFWAAVGVCLVLAGSWVWEFCFVDLHRLTDTVS